MSSLTITPTSSPVKPPAPHTTPIKAEDIFQGVKSERTNRKLSSVLESRGFGKTPEPGGKLNMVKLLQYPQLRVPVVRRLEDQIGRGTLRCSPIKRRRLSESTSYKIYEFARVNADNFSRNKTIDFSESKMKENSKPEIIPTAQEEARYQEMARRDVEQFQAQGGVISQDDHGRKHKVTKRKSYQKGSKGRDKLKRSTMGKKAAAKFFPEENYDRLFSIAEKNYRNRKGALTTLPRYIGWSNGKETNQIKLYITNATGKGHIRPF